MLFPSQRPTVGPRIAHHTRRHTRATLAQNAGYGWAGATVTPIQVLAELTTVPGYTSWMSAGVFAGLVYLAMVWAAALLALVGWCAYAFATQRKAQTPERLLATMGAASAGVLYIPLLYLLLSTFTCHLPKVRRG